MQSFRKRYKAIADCCSKFDWLYCQPIYLQNAANKIQDICTEHERTNKLTIL